MGDEGPKGQIPWTQEELLLKKLYYKTNVITLKRVSSAPTAAPDSATSVAAPDTQVSKRPKIRAAGTMLSSISSNALPEAEKLDFNPRDNLLAQDWDSRQEQTPLKYLLDGLYLFDNNNFDQKGKNSLVVWATMPSDSEHVTFALASNSAHLLDDPQLCFYYKFDVSHGSITQSSRSNAAPISQPDHSIKGSPIQYNHQFQLRMVICVQGVAVYLDGKLLAEYTYKAGIVPNQATLYFMCLTEDEETRQSCSVVVNRVWWGNTTPYVTMSGGKKRFAFEFFAGEGSSDSRPTHSGASKPVDDVFAERTLFVSGLPLDGTAESELKRMFDAYEIDNTSDDRECVAVDLSKGQGVVKLVSSRNVDAAIKYLHNIRMGEGQLSVVPARRKQVPNWFYC